MSKSGVEIGNAVTDLYQTFKLDKSDKHEAWIVFKLSDDKSKVEVDDCATAPICSKDVDECENKAHFEQIKALMTDDKPRFLVFDFRCKRDDDSICEKTAYIYWCSDNAPPRMRMVYATTSEDMKKKLGCNAEFQVNDKGDFDYDEMKGKIISKK
ncbi:uncharacterized protein LOC142342642 [Convolutriloba macropyga]|uniref:uncharacterized protein LOC142342642 n=1 Tax=Convolutriloba macropyga TaxID=536237 RepID=UPI003F51F2CF